MLLNLRALPNGLESHKGFLKSELDSWLAGGLEEADVTFVCTGVEGEAGQTVRLAAHQVRRVLHTFMMLILSGIYFTFYRQFWLLYLRFSGKCLTVRAAAT